MSYHSNINDSAHFHLEECAILARARIRLLRSEIAMNQAIIRAREEHSANLVDVVSHLQRTFTRLDINDLMRLIPEMSPPLPPLVHMDTPNMDVVNPPPPPTLQRQTNIRYGNRRPLGDITNQVNNENWNPQ